MVAVPTIAEAAKLLDVSESTVRNMLKDGRLRGRRGKQSVRPRWKIEPDADGHLVDSEGRKIVVSGPSLEEVLAQIDELRAEVRALRGAPRAASDVQRIETYRVTMLTIQAANERRARVAALQAEATRLQSEANIRQTEAIEELNALVSEQTQIISGQIVGGVHEDLTERR